MCVLFPRRDIKKRIKRVVFSLFFPSFCCASSKDIFALKFLRTAFSAFWARQKLKAELSSENKRNHHQNKRFNKMGFLGLGRKKKSEAELAEEERIKRANMPRYARMFGMDSCCGNRKENKKSKDNTNTNGASSMD